MKGMNMLKKLIAAMAVMVAFAILPAGASAHRMASSTAIFHAVNWGYNHSCGGGWSCDPVIGGGVSRVSIVPLGVHSWNVKILIYQRHLLPPFGFRHFCRNVVVGHVGVVAASHGYAC